MKAITPVIALVMLLLITTGVVGVSYLWFSGMLSANTEKNIIVPAGGIYCNKNKINVVVQNAGASSNITDGDIVFADINGVNAKNSLFFGDFNRFGLVGYWRFEQSNGSAATNDSSGYGNMGTLTNMNLTGNSTSGPTLGGRFGNALLFDGVDDYVDTGNSISLNSTGKFTIDAWIYPIDSTREQIFIQKGATFGNPGFAVGHSASGATQNVRFNVGRAGGETFIDSSTSLTMNAWNHIAATFDGTTSKIYINGVKDSTEGTPPSYDASPEPLWIGTNKRQPYVTFPFNGTIDEVQIWNRSLSAPEIAQLNKTNAGNFTLGPGQGKTVISNYPVFQPGKYTVRMGTKNSVAENTVNCQ